MDQINPDDSYSLYIRALASLEKDNKDEFVSLFNRLLSCDKEVVIGSIDEYDAANCVAAILDGKVGQSWTTYYLSTEENIPLHNAARKATPRIASFLLDKGFSADFRADYDSPPIILNNALPLNVSLEFARYCFWSFCRTESPIHQIISLCKWENHHKTIRLIARNTKEIKHEFFKYLKQGNVVEVGALLAIASDLIMSSPSTTDGENGNSISFKNIMEMRQFLLAEMSRSLGASDTQLKEMKKTLRLLEIFDRVGDKLLAHMPMWDNYTSESGNRVASLIKDAAYDEEKEVEYDREAVPRIYYTPFLHERHLPSCVEAITVVDNIRHVYTPSKRKFSTKIHFPSSLEEGSCHVDVPLPLPTIVKGAVTKHLSSKRHAPFIRAFVNAVRHLRYR